MVFSRYPLFPCGKSSANVKLYAMDHRLSETFSLLTAGADRGFKTYISSSFTAELSTGLDVVPQSLQHGRLSFPSLVAGSSTLPNLGNPCCPF
jgi:hypothetical protein